MLVLAAEPELDRHDTGIDHPEQPARLRAALSGIDAAGLRDAVVRTEARRASEEELALVHPRSYFEALRAFCEAGGGAVDPDTITVPGSWDTALLAAGGGLAAVDALMDGAGDVGFVAARPPGHHASADRSMGFCLLNNIAISAAYLAERSKATVIPTYIHESGMLKGPKYAKAPIYVDAPNERRHHVIVAFGKPLRCEEGENMRRFGARIERAVEEIGRDVSGDPSYGRTEPDA